MRKLSDLVHQALPEAHYQRLRRLGRWLPDPRRVRRLEERITELSVQNNHLTVQNNQLAVQNNQLTVHNDELTEAVVAKELKLQEKAALDYQILMVHQGLVAEFQDVEPNFRDFLERCKPYTMTSVERLYSLHKCVEHIVAAEVPGDLAECGVWRGGSCMMMATSLLGSGTSDRRIMMFDTFEGHPMPDPERDVDLWGNSGYEEWRRQTEEGTVKGWGMAELDDVRENMASTGYPAEKLDFIKGLVEDTVPANVPARLCLLRLDTDWYESTRVALTHLYPRLSPGGILILDDYGHYKGQRQAVDEYLAKTGERLLMHRIDYSCRVAVKPGS